MSSADITVTGNSEDVVVVVAVGTTDRIESPCQGEVTAYFESAKKGVESGNVGRGLV